MFGTNEIAPPVYIKGSRESREVQEGKNLIVNSIFYTLQGEGPHAGEPAVFIRLTGCNLKCHFCDTEFEEGKERSVGNIVQSVISAAPPDVCSFVVLTGGEPLRQQIVPLCRELLRMGYAIQIETAGTVFPPAVMSEDKKQCFTLGDLIRNYEVELICSPKTRVINEQVEKHCHHYKYIITAPVEGAGDAQHMDGLPIMSTQQPNYPMMLFRPKDPSVTIWVQPCFEYEHGYTDTGPTIEDPNSKRNTANAARCVELAKKHGYRVSMQLHKILDIE